ncbi:MAG: YabP/YqfC family sporulation protein [Clostridia bacterium]|nr:YabP/YqfC family sporulation protein [Clostridia bacterium]
MFNFLGEINDSLELPLTSVFSRYKYVNLAGKMIYVQGYKDILNFDEQEVVLKIKEGELKIVGKNLNIKELNLNSIVIEGIIILIEEVGGKNA